MFYTYVLESLDHEHLYIGFTSDLKKRIIEHDQGRTSSTKRYGKWRLIYYEASLDRQDARRRETYLKTTQGGRLLKRRLKEYMFKNKYKKFAD